MTTSFMIPSNQGPQRSDEMSSTLGKRDQFSMIAVVSAFADCWRDAWATVGSASNRASSAYNGEESESE